MRKRVKHINLFLTIIACALVFVKAIEFINISKKKDFILTEMKIKEAVLANSVQSCELISDIKHRKPNFQDVGKANNAQSKEEYRILKNSIDNFIDKLFVLNSHTSFVVDNLKLFKDHVSNKIYLGRYDFPLILCDAHTLRINEKTTPYKSNQIYEAFIHEDIEIEYNRYKLNYIDGKIDSTIIIRYIEKNTLYKK
jgi:hypothetical protein